MPKISYTLSVNAGVQIRFDPLVHSETRINPARATRPMAAPQAPCSSSVDSPVPSLSPSASEAKVMQILSTIEESEQNLLPILYRSRDPSCTQHLPVELRELIQGFIPRNPFFPPEKLIHSVVEVCGNVLSSVRCGPHIFPGVNSVGSSIHNVFLAHEHNAKIQKPTPINEKQSSPPVYELKSLTLSADASQPSPTPTEHTLPPPLPPTPLGSQIFKSYNVMSLGESCLFLNLFPFAPGHAVVTNSESYYVSMTDFTLRQLRDSLCLCIEYVKACARVAWRGESYQSDKCKGGEGSGTICLDVSDTLSVTELHDKDTLTAPHRLVWPVLVWNYMPPSAGSIIHPHWQCFCEPGPSPMLKRMLEEGERWMDEAHTGPWRDEMMEKTSIPPANFVETLVSREFALHHSKEDAQMNARGNMTLLSMLRSRYIGYVSVPGTGSEAVPVPTNSNVSGDTLSCATDAIAKCSLAEDDASTASTADAASRYIPAGEHVFIVAPFAPRTTNEVHLYFVKLHKPLHVSAAGEFGAIEGELMDVAEDYLDGNVADVSGLSPAQQHAYAKAMLGVVHSYDRMGIGAFNMTMFTGPIASLEEIRGQNADESSEAEYYSRGTIPVDVIDNIVDKNKESSMYIPSRTIGRSFSMVTKFMSRPAPVSCYTNDTGPTERMMDTFVINVTPEDYAQFMRDGWAEIMQNIK